MLGVMVVPSRGRFAMGQNAQIAAEDIPEVIPIGKFGLEGRSDEELKRIYAFAKTSVALRTKCAFLSELAKKISGDPSLLGFYRSTPDGQAFIDVLSAAKGFFLAVTQPKIMASLQNLVTDLEVNQLPKRGYEIRGRVPIYVFGKPRLSYADTRVDVPPRIPVKGTINFGDLSKTRLYDDVNALRLIASDMKIKGMPVLGAEPVAVSTIILAVIKYVIFPSIISYGLWKTVKAFNEKSVTIELPPGFEKLDPNIQEAILNGKSMLEGIKDVLKWLAIGAGVLVVGGVALYFLRK